MKVSEIFNEKPERWGLRGDPYFWEYLKKLTEDIETISPDGLEKLISDEFLSLSGKPLAMTSMGYVEQFAHGGMSSGGIDGAWWIETGIPLLKIRLQGDKAPKLKIAYERCSVCAGDDVNAGKCIIEMPPASTLGDLMQTVLCGGNGNDRPIPFTGAYSSWVIKSNIGELAVISTGKDGAWHIECTGRFSDTLLCGLGIEWMYGERVRSGL